MRSTHNLQARRGAAVPQDEPDRAARERLLPRLDALLQQGLPERRQDGRRGAAGRQLRAGLPEGRMRFHTAFKVEFSLVSGIQPLN